MDDNVQMKDKDSGCTISSEPEEKELKRGVTYKYTTCKCNCGGNHQCILKAHVKDGKVIRVEPDDRYNTNAGREDDAITYEQLIRTHLQRRPCEMGMAFHRYLYHPDRILYPLKRKPGTGRGEGHYVRISWDEALDTIAQKMTETREKYGPHSIITPYSPNNTAERLFSLWGAGVEGWGWCSYEATRLMSHVIAGERGWEVAGYASGSGADMLAHSKLIVLWGEDPTVGHQGPAHMFAWFIKMARERGAKVIIIDPRYSAAAQVLADQWIPIKPGTDHAMYMAMANVLFKEDLWERDFVEKYVEPHGFEKWRNYVLGVEDGVNRTPEWAEEKCAVPAGTIRSLARAAATIRPAFLCNHWAVTRKSDGEQSVATFAALQAMLGYWGTPGAGPALHIGPYRQIPVQLFIGPDNGHYVVPKLYRSHNWAEAVLLLDKVKNGELSEKEYMKEVGWREDPSYIRTFDPHFLFWGRGSKPYASNHVVTACNSSDNQIKAMNRMDFIVTMHSVMNPTVQMADIILPAQDWMWEEASITRSASYGGFEAVNYCPGVVPPPGEVRPWMWVYTKLAQKLGIDPKKFFQYYTTDENWDNDWELAQQEAYQGLVKYYEDRGKVIPAWDEFKNGQFINCDELDDEPFTGWDAQLKEGKPFRTQSGKIEFYSKYVANEENRGKGRHLDFTQRLYDNLPGDWGDMTPSPTYRAMPRGIDDPMTGNYPLVLLTSHCRYRVHYFFWEHKWLRNHTYRHRVWINAVDAKSRGIKDNDMIKVYNDRGTVLMPAYVTSRIMPGIVMIHAGGKRIDGENGMDIGASPSTLLGGENKSCLAPARASNLVQVEKYIEKL